MDWKLASLPKGVKLNWLVHTGEAFLAGAGKTIYRSNDGVAWEPTDFAPPRGTVKWSDGERFIASAWPGKMSYSADGKTWQESPPLTANGINRVVQGSK
jgi:hypothetical protein